MALEHYFHSEHCHDWLPSLFSGGYKPARQQSDHVSGLTMVHGRYIYIYIDDEAYV